MNMVDPSFTQISNLLAVLGDAKDPRWGEFFQSCTQRLIALARSRGLRHHDAQDVAQEVGVYLPGIVSRYDRKRPFRSYLLAAGWYQIATFWRNRSRELTRQRRFEAIRRKQLHEKAAQDPDVLDSCCFVEDMRCLPALSWDFICEHFGKSTREAFVRYGLNHEPADKVAAELGMSVDDVYSAKSRVKNRVSSFLKKLLYSK